MKSSYFTLGAKLWLFVALVMALLVFTLVFATNRSTEVQTRADAAFAAQNEKINLALQWSGQVETQLTRIVATATTADPAIDELFKGQIPAGSARITEVQKKVETSGLDDTEKKLFDRIGEERKVALVSLAKVRDFKAAGDQPSAAAEVKTNLLSSVDKYVKSLQEFSELQRGRYATLNEGFQVERNANAWIARGLVAGLLVALILGTLVLIRQIRQPLKEAIAVAEKIASGDLSAKVSVDRGDEFGEMMRALAHMQEQLVHLVSDVRRGTDNIATASEEIATGNQDLANRTEQTASNLEKTASSMEQLTATVKQSADSARQANQLAASAAQVAQRGGSVVSQVVTTMDDINASSRKISDIISVIDGIAFQTNILALNAAVEAARAGEQGRGFAVVASEVRSLAGRSAEAAKEIKLLINTSVDKVQGGSALVAQAGETMTEIVSSVQRVTDIMGEITAATSEQAQGIAQVNTAVNELDQMTQQNAALVEESAAAASSMKDQAQRLAEVVSAFKLDNQSVAAKAAPGSSTKPKPSTATPRPALAKPAASPAKTSKPATGAKPMASLSNKPAAPASKPVTTAKPSNGDDDWETF
ncbi:methyl-accepting chemotaxis protein [Rhodoferax saidenbachensis]|uniref:Methyl-accepting chemotaxis protein n=1 Tax=Rhodoferax saidenbachensis TaxID=1484693 RepID=A0A1P8K5L7_9BURK|nr:methyl-accepting chemotaxis protein [Rhodoferax saidenbachensis]APW41303.1 methyl-accepting chemotaxis protein [Rhodoferax saidenbachensis]